MTFHESEMSVLAACLLDGAAVDKARALVGWRDFEAPATGTTFAAMVEMRAASMPIDLVTLAAHLQGRGNLEVVGGYAGLSRLAEYATTTANVEAHARIVRDRARQRETRKVAAAVLSGDKSGGEAAERLRVLAAPPDATRPPAHVSHGLDRLFTQGAQPSVPLGLECLAGLGVSPCHLTVVGARPGVGKTAFLGGVALTAADRGWDVLFLSLEMPSLEIQQRLLAGHSGTLLGDVKRAALPALIAAAGKLGELSIWVEDGHEEPRISLDLEGIAALVKAYAGSGGTRPKVVLVDYLQFIRVRQRFDRRHLEVGHVCRELKRLARDAEVALVVAAQVGRSADQRGKEARPQMSDLAESSDIEKNADQILLIHRDKADGSDAAWIKVEKNRHGPTGVEECRYNGPLCLFQDLGSWQ